MARPFTVINVLSPLLPDVTGLVTGAFVLSYGLDLDLDLDLDLILALDLAGFIPVWVCIKRTNSIQRNVATHTSDELLCGIQVPGSHRIAGHD